MSDIQTFSDCYNSVLRYLDEVGDTGTTLALAKDLVKSAHRKRLTEESWPFMLWPTEETFTTSSSSRLYTLHQEFQRPLWFRNRTTKQLLREVPFRTIESTGKDWNNDTGAAAEFFLGQRTQVQNQPATASTISLASSSASDTGGPTVILRGMTTNGVTTETLTATGTSTATSTNSFSTILQVTKTGTWVGTLTLTAGATTILKLFPAEYGRSYTALEFLNIPDTATIGYRFFRQPSPLANDNDLLDIPPPFGDLVVYDTLLLWAGYNTELAGAAVKVWTDHRDEILQNLRTTVMEAQSIGSAIRTVRDLTEDAFDHHPHVHF